jgi:heme O synthase-like polyprenyltransferase
VILDRVAWAIYLFIFAVIPFTVVFFRTDMIAWHYYLAGAMFLAGALAICAINLLQSDDLTSRDTTFPASSVSSQLNLK